MTHEVLAFSYAAVAPEVGSRLRETAAAIKSSLDHQVEEVIATGKALIEAKAALPHGHFGEWLSAEFGWTAKTAQNYMAAAKAFGSNTKRISHFPVATIYRLAALPLEPRERILNAAEKKQGEVADLIAQEAYAAKQAAADAKKSPETKAREKSRQAARRLQIERNTATLQAEEAKRRRLTENLVREIVDAAPEIIDKLIDLTRLSPHFIGELERAKADVQRVNSTRWRFGVKDEAQEHRELFDTLSEAARDYGRALEIFPAHINLAIDHRLWAQERKSASGRIVKSESLHGFIHDHQPLGIGANWALIEELLEDRPEVLARWNAIRKAEGST